MQSVYEISNIYIFILRDGHFLSRTIKFIEEEHIAASTRTYINLYAT